MIPNAEIVPPNAIITKLRESSKPPVLAIVVAPNTCVLVPVVPLVLFDSLLLVPPCDVSLFVVVVEVVVSVGVGVDEGAAVTSGVAVGVGVGVGLDDGDTDELGLADGDGLGDATQFGPEMVFPSKVTVPAVCTKSRPFKVAPVFRALTPLSAKIFPINEVVVPRVTELPTLHHTLQGSSPVTDEPGEVISVDTVLKIQTPDPVRFKFPDSEKLLVEQ